MRKLASPTTLLAAATLPLLVLPMAYPASAASPASASGMHAASHTAAALRLPAAAAPPHGAAPTPTAPAVPHPAFIRPPIAIPTRPVAVLPGPNVAYPGLYPLQASASAVTVTWYDRSINEQQFKNELG